MQIFLLDLEEYAPHVLILLLPSVISVLFYLRYIFLALAPSISLRLTYLRHLHPLRHGRHQRPGPLRTRKAPFL